MNAAGRRCEQCGAEAQSGAAFCTACGASQAADPVSPPPGIAAGGGLAFALRSALGLMFAPAAWLTTALQAVPWPVAVAIPAAAFGLFFLQAGLDRAEIEAGSAGDAIQLGAAGVAFGAAGVPLMAAIAWTGARLAGNSNPVGWAVRAFALSYSPTLIYVLLGLAANLALGWHTAVAFGITGLLWSFGPILAVLRRMTNGNAWLSLGVATACGAFLLLAWGVLGPEAGTAVSPEGPG